MGKKKESALTKGQAKVLEFIRARYQSEGIPPSYRDIQKHFGFRAVGTVQDYVRALKEKGALERPGNRKVRRARQLMPKGSVTSGIKTIPIYGEIAAGATRESEQIPLGEIVMPGDGKAQFALRVTGNSMINAGIFEGDLLLVDPKARAAKGDIVVALVEGETTVKRFYPRGEWIELHPENSDMKPIVVQAKSVQIQGRVVGLQRKI